MYNPAKWLFYVLLFSSFIYGQQINYTVQVDEPNRNNFLISIETDVNGQAATEFCMPAWMPGSYTIKDNAANIYDVSARDERGIERPVAKTDKQTWRVESDGAKKIILDYRVYAYEHNNPYTAHVDPDFAYFNGALVFMYVKDRLDRPTVVRFRIPEGWKLHTAFQQQISPDTFAADNYDEFIDTPVFMGNINSFRFKVAGKSHYVVYSGSYECNQEQITADLTKLVNWFYEMFGELPYQHYTFFVRVEDPGRGGIEHLYSNVSCVVPEALSGDHSDSRYFGNFLMLESHEYFHLYNVKRIRPEQLGPFDYTGEVYTKLLWVSEGFTSYYTHRPLVKSGIIEAEKIFPSLSGYYNSLMENTAIGVKPLAMYSFDAWLKSDIPDYTFRVYYYKGALVGLMIDFEMRSRTNHEKTMDGFFRFLYEDVYKQGKTMTLQRFTGYLKEYSGIDFSEFIQTYVENNADLPLDDYMVRAGLQFVPQKKRPDIGIKFDPSEKAGAVVLFVGKNSPADKAGISRGDVLVRINADTVVADSVMAQMETLPVNQPVTLTWKRAGEHRQQTLIFDRMIDRDYKLQRVESPSKEQNEFYQKWLLP